MPVYSRYQLTVWGSWIYKINGAQIRRFHSSAFHHSVWYNFTPENKLYSALLEDEIDDPNIAYHKAKALELSLDRSYIADSLSAYNDAIELAEQDKKTYGQDVSPEVEEIINNSMDAIDRINKMFPVE